MFQFFSAIGSIFTTIVNFVIGIFEMLMNFIRIVYKGTAFLFALVPNLPPFCMSFLAVTLGIAILFNVMNKGG